LGEGLGEATGTREKAPHSTIILSSDVHSRSFIITWGAALHFQLLFPSFMPLVVLSIPISVSCGGEEIGSKKWVIISPKLLSVI
jgi:hypothetical protein